MYFFCRLYLKNALEYNSSIILVVRLSLEFVLKRSIKISNHELVHNSREVVKRTLVFNYIAAVVMHSEKHLIQERDFVVFRLRPNNTLSYKQRY